MKLTDIFRGIDEIGKEVRFYPKLNVITGSNNASLLLCYLIGWCGNQADKKEGWMCQSNSDISEQTGLTRKEQQSARKALKKLGVIEEQLRGIPRTTYYRLKIDTLNEIWNRYREDPDGYTIKRPDVKPDVKGGFRDELPDISNDIRSLQESSNQDGQKEQFDFSSTRWAKRPTIYSIFFSIFFSRLCSTLNSRLCSFPARARRTRTRTHARYAKKTPSILISDFVFDCGG